jgi:ArsR family transcriptional regulator
MDEELPDEMDALRALAHPVRWGILERLAAEPGICACDFTEFFDVSQPTISVHLKVLREAGLVTSRRIGTTICYSIAPSRLAMTAPGSPRCPPPPPPPTKDCRFRSRPRAPSWPGRFWHEELTRASSVPSQRPARWR